MIGPYTVAIGVLLLLCLVLGGLLYSHMKMARAQRERLALDRHHDALNAILRDAITTRSEGWVMRDVPLRRLLSALIYHSRP